MGSEEETKKKNEVFDAEAASLFVKELRGTFASGKTKSYGWRVSQLKSLMKMLNEREPDIVDALRQDLDKPELESSIYEVVSAFSHFFFVFKYDIDSVLSITFSHISSSLLSLLFDHDDYIIRSIHLRRLSIICNFGVFFSINFLKRKFNEICLLYIYEGFCYHYFWSGT